MRPTAVRVTVFSPARQLLCLYGRNNREVKVCVRRGLHETGRRVGAAGGCHLVAGDRSAGEREQPGILLGGGEGAAVPVCGFSDLSES